MSYYYKVCLQPIPIITYRRKFETERNDFQAVGYPLIPQTYRTSAEITNSLLKTMELMSQNETSLSQTGTILEEDNTSLNVGQIAFFCLSLINFRKQAI